MYFISLIHSFFCYIYLYYNKIFIIIIKYNCNVNIKGRSINFKIRCILLVIEGYLILHISILIRWCLLKSSNSFRLIFNFILYKK